MRTVLAVDEMLAHAVSPKLPGEVEVLGHMAMRDLGRAESVATLRRLVLASPSVLAIGGQRWTDALDYIRAMRLPYRVPVVLLAPPESKWELIAPANALGVFSMVPLVIGASGTAATISAACQAAGRWTRRRGRPRVLQLVERDEPRRPATSSPTRLLLLPRPV